MSRPPRAREKVLEAAEAVLVTRGASGFTLDAVAERAEVSKGGLTYHFPTKEALLEALVARAVQAVDALLAPAARAEEPGAFTRAYLDVTVPATSDGRPAQAHGASHGNRLAALTVAVAMDPNLLAPLRAAYAKWQVRLEADGIDSAAATTVRLAVDGWWMATLLDLPALSADVHHRTRSFLEHLSSLPPGKPVPGVVTRRPAQRLAEGCRAAGVWLRVWLRLRVWLWVWPEVCGGAVAVPSPA
jgi:AcrR family transcriptional regulator